VVDQGGYHQAEEEANDEAHEQAEQLVQHADPLQLSILDHSAEGAGQDRTLHETQIAITHRAKLLI
jgi:hypothetical protein